MQRRERHLAGADEEQLAVVDLVHLRAVGGEEAGLLHRLLAHEHRRHDRREPLAARACAVTHCTSASSSSTASRMRYAKREPLIATACSRLDPAHRLAERGVVERRAARACRRRRAAPRRRPRRRRAPTRRPGSAPAARARAPRRRAAASVVLERLQLVLQRAGGRDLRRALVGRGLADLLRRRVLPRRAAPRPALQRSRRAASAASTSSIRPARPACVRCRARYSGSSRSRLRSITASSLVADLRRAGRRATRSRRATPW